MDRPDLLAAGDRNLGQVLRLLARTTPEGAVDDDGRLLLISTSRTWPGPYTNGALRLDRSYPPAEVLARAESFFATRSAGYCIWIADHADTDLEAACIAAGLMAVSPAGTPRMALEHPLAMATEPDGVTLDEVADDRGRLDYLAVTIEAYSGALLPADVVQAQLAGVDALHGPGVRAVVARRRGRPVAAAMVVVSDGVAGIQLVGTIPEGRGQGLGELCTRWATNVGFQLGAEAAVLEASEMGEPLYRRMGFIEISRYRWCFGPPQVPRPAGRPAS